MHRLFVLFLILPWWGYLPIAAGVVWLGELAHEQAVETEAERKAAYAVGPPPSVDLSVFKRATDRGAADEVHVRGWIETGYNYELVEHTYGVPTNRRFLYMLFGEGDTPGSKTVRSSDLGSASMKPRSTKTHPSVPSKRTPCGFSTSSVKCMVTPFA